MVVAPATALFQRASLDGSLQLNEILVSFNILCSSNFMPFRMHISPYTNISPWEDEHSTARYTLTSSAILPESCYSCGLLSLNARWGLPCPLRYGIFFLLQLQRTDLPRTVELALTIEETTKSILALKGIVRLEHGRRIFVPPLTWSTW